MKFKEKLHLKYLLTIHMERQKSIIMSFCISLLYAHAVNLRGLFFFHNRKQQKTSIA